MIQAPLLSISFLIVQFQAVESNFALSLFYLAFPFILTRTHLLELQSHFTA